MSSFTSARPDAPAVSVSNSTFKGTPDAETSQAIPRQSIVTGMSRIVAFFALFVGLLFATDRAVTFGLRRVKTSGFGVTNRIVTGAINAEVVISGSSRAVCHYDSRLIEQITGSTTYNIGRNGSQTDMQLAVLKAYLRHNASPKLVIHNLDLFSFVTTRDIFDPAQYMPYLDEPSIYSGIRRIYPHAWKWKLLPLYGYVVEDMRFAWLTGLKALVGLQPPETHQQGFVARHAAWTQEFDRFRDGHTEGVEFAIESDGVNDLTELVATCRRAGVPLLFVYSPVYYEMRALEKNRSDVFAQFKAIADRFGVPIWDYSDSPISTQQTHFYNSQHLNAQGAAAFSADLAHRIVREHTVVTTREAQTPARVSVR